jgi:sugar phosphate isomerase/epimerase
MTDSPSKLALTLYTLRATCQDEGQLGATLEAVKDMGYQAIQLSGVGPIPPETVARLLKAHGLVCCGTHEDLHDYVDRLGEVQHKLKTLGCHYTALSHPGHRFWSASGVESLAAVLNGIGHKCAEMGYRFGYHNHHSEFARFDGRLFLEELIRRTDPGLVDVELDVYWVQRGGGNPAGWIRKLKGRVPVIHLKDFVIVDDQPVYAEVGEGNLDWKDILAACDEAGCRWYVVEQDEPFGSRPILESVRVSYRNLIAMGIR